MNQNLLTVSEAADRLGVSPRRVRALIEHGQLEAERLGSIWLVTASAVRRADRARHRRGRPFKPDSAWRWINLLESDGPPARASFDEMRRALRPRALHKLAYIHPGVLPLLDEHVVYGGRDAALHDGVPVDPGEPKDVYVKESDWLALSDRVGARPVSDGANVALHVVPDEAWPFGVGERFTSLWSAWLDLADRDDRAADTVLDRLVGGRVDG